jgi:hypothetical protein
MFIHVLDKTKSMKKPNVYTCGQDKINDRGHRGSDLLKMFMFLGLVLELLCLKPLLTIIQLYSWWRRPEGPGENHRPVAGHRH